MELRNDKSGETIISGYTNESAALHFAGIYHDKNHWLWYHIHNALQQKNLPNENDQNSQTFLSDFFVVAIGMGLRRPMIRLHYKDQRFKVYLSKKGTICLKSGMLSYDEATDKYGPQPLGDEQYIGCWYDGKFLQGREGYDSNTKRAYTPTESDFLKEMGNDPVTFCAKCSKDLGRCCYCNQPLEDPISKRLGYGKTCASRWQLPWGVASYTENAPSFAKAYPGRERHLQQFCAHLRANPTDDTAWYIFADCLEEHGLPRVNPPKPGTVIPK